MSYISIPVPEPAKVSLVVGDGKRFAMVQVDRAALNSNPAKVISLAMRAMDKGMEESAREGTVGWTEIDVVQTERGYALSPAALDEVMRASFGSDYKEHQ